VEQNRSSIASELLVVFVGDLLALRARNRASPVSKFHSMSSGNALAASGFIRANLEKSEVFEIQKERPV
jgi:hypothetical protein